MKALTKNFLAAACLVATAFSLNACISNNGEEYDTTIVPLTSAEKTAQINAMAGTFKGKATLFTINPYGVTKADSADINFTVKTDSSVVISDFPLRLFAWYAPTGPQKEALKSATASLTGTIQLYAPMNYVRQRYGNGVYFFALWPYKQDFKTPWAVTFPYTFSGATQNMKVSFAADYALGYQNSVILNAYTSTKRIFQCFLLPKQIKLGDGTEVNSQRSFIFVRGTK